MARILVVGMNPVWQHVWEFSDLITGAVNRAATGWQGASGKGFNAAYALRCLGHEVVLLQCLAGETGKRIGRACEQEGIRSVAAEVPGESRTCATLLRASSSEGDLKSGEVTELIAPFSLETSAAESAGAILLEAATRLEREFRPEGLLISGTLPQGMDSGLYGRIAAGCGASVKIGDTVAGWDRGLGAYLHGIKINRGEWRSLEAQYATGGISLVWPEWRLLTDGGRGALCERGQASGDAVADPGSSVAWELPALPADMGIVNPIGAGDTASAGWLHAWLRGDGPERGTAFALALATASCLHREPARFDRAIAEGLRPQQRPAGTLP